MLSDIIQTKLNLPAIGSSYVTRPRLLNVLDAVLQSGRRLLLVSASAGCGKTMLVAHWLRQRSLRCAWYSLDEADSDPVRFFLGLLASIQKAAPEVDLEALVSQLGAGALPSPDILSSTMANALLDLQSDLIVVLDDYHSIRSRSVHAVLETLIHHQPPRLRMAILSRVDPAFQRSKLRVRDQLIELRAADLFFTREEAADFIQNVAGLQLSEDAINKLLVRTEGWIAGLHLVSITLRQHPQVEEFINAFAGSNRYIFDFLAEEVLNEQPQAVRNFLLKTCILDRMCAPLCAELTSLDIRTAQQNLEMLDANNLFIYPLDDERRWFRYHGLFSSFLQSHLAQHHPDESDALNGRAAYWHAANGYDQEAVDYALRAHKFSLAAQFIERAGLAIIRNGQYETFLSWIHRYPPGWEALYPALDLFLSWTLINTGHIGAAAARLERIDLAPFSPIYHALMHVVLAQLAWFSGDGANAIEHAQQAQNILSAHEESHPFRAIITLFAATFTSEGLRLSGHLYQAEAVCRAALMGASSLQDNWPVLEGNLHLKLGICRYEFNDLDAAERHTRLGLEMVRKSGNKHFESSGCALLALIAQARGNSQAADVWMLSAVDVYRQNAPLPNLAYLQAIQVRIRIQQLNAGQAAPGAFAEIAAWRLAADSFDLPPFISSYIQFTVIRVCLLERRFEQVDAYFQTLNHIAEVSGQPGLWAEIYLMQALLMQAQDRSADATAAFAQSLTYSEPQGYMRLYLNEGKVAERLLRAYAAPSAYTARLLEAFEDQHRIEVKRSDPYGLIDPLSERELEVLRLMAAGLTNAEISSRLYITLRTVKFHTGNILGKLGATNRTEAVTRARAMNLILE